MSIAELATQDTHQTLTIAVAVVSGESRHAQTMMDETIRFMEDTIEAEITDVEIIKRSY